MLYQGKHVSIDDDGAITLNLWWRDPETGEEGSDPIQVGSYPHGLSQRVRRHFSLIGEAAAEYDRAMDEVQSYFEREGDAERAAIVDGYNRSTSPAYM